MDAAATHATTKSERTRALIRDVALKSFRERGYDATTIRLIAQDAGISVGTTNYHFASKNDLVQELYLDVQLAHRDAVMPLLATTDDLVERLALVFRTGLDELEPYHRFAPEFLSAAMSPRSSVNPLSEESTASRDIVVGVFREAVTGAKRSLPAEFEGHPLRKDYPLRAREVKPWPGLVDVEPMPGGDDDEEEAVVAEGGDA